MLSSQHRQRIKAQAMARKKKKGSQLPAIIASIVILLLVTLLIGWALWSGMGDPADTGSFMEDVGEAHKYDY